MLDLIILFFLVFGLLTGLKRGFILQVVYLSSVIVSFIIARTYFDDLAPKLELWVPYPNIGDSNAALSILTGGHLEEAYYRGVAFVLLFIGSKIALHIIGSMFDFVAMLPILKQINRLLGAVLGFAETYLILFILLFLAALIPAEQIQNLIDKSLLADLIVNHTPVLSDKIFDLWIGYFGKGS